MWNERQAHPPERPEATAGAPSRARPPGKPGLRAWAGFAGVIGASVGPFRARSALLLLLTLFLVPGTLAAADAPPFFDDKTVDLRMILAPPPGDDSPETRREVEQILEIQATRSPAMEAAAKADNASVVWRFGDVLGANFTKERLPQTAALFERIKSTERAVVFPAKAAYARTRPFLLDSRVSPLVKAASESYPSGHAAYGVMTGIVLANMVPEKAPEIMARAWQFGWNRVIAGVHYPSDVEMGRIAGTVIAFELFRQPDFKAAFELSKQELRSALGVP